MGGFRIPRRRGRQPSRGAPTYDFAEFCEKLHEIEKILGRAGGVPGVPPLNPPLTYIRASESEILNTLQGFH